MDKKVLLAIYRLELQSLRISMVGVEPMGYDPSKNDFFELCFLREAELLRKIIQLEREIEPPKPKRRWWQFS